MEVFKVKESKEWNGLLQRPATQQKNLQTIVQGVYQKVAASGDEALKNFTQEFDGVQLESIRVSRTEVNEAGKLLDAELKKAIQVAAANIEKFHANQVSEEAKVTTMPGVYCWRKSIPIQKVGLYIPGGSAPLFSTVLMLGIPAKIAGSKKVILCTPPNKEGKIHPAILFTASLCGIQHIYKVGGAQAIAAMVEGTETIPAVQKIFGPGNSFVTEAKIQAQQKGVAIDMPAGPSEVLVIADENADASFVAADLLSQAEHGPDSQVILVTNSETIAKQVAVEVKNQLAALPRKDIAELALENSKTFVVPNLEVAMELSNDYAPEHLIINTLNADALAEEVEQAGSVFIGSWSCESAGDYASGTNHTLPTYGFASAYSGVSVDSFVKKITYQKLSEEGIQNIGNTVEIMAEAEQLFAHKNAVTLRLNALKNV